MAGASKQNRDSSGAKSRSANQAIRAAIPKFLPPLTDEYEWLFLCECGCLTWVERTLAEFDSDGAFASGHISVRSEPQDQLVDTLT
jgi:hypothetical protein